ncbi:hypothetical protein CROQUDRAFT_103017 [Cronartium quercuum f. sp. fusiforme G11]|uniref:Uncharacterized protein n=1 Tax=Cronartium quercuum f. sp. fusiforme G11 TaxID=708437 RepID=A0A9P6NV73_9BASI|nr:hypothetical protein CROQUDRAFT_103017 [Cronartium quercuum f. sp. fusiforme G11]
MPAGVAERTTLWPVNNKNHIKLHRFGRWSFLHGSSRVPWLMFCSENMLFSKSSNLLIQLIGLSFSTLQNKLCRSQSIDGQFFTPGLLIISQPQSGTTVEAGQNLNGALEVSGNGRLPKENTEPGNQLATAILSLHIFLISSDLNMTVLEGPELLQKEKGSSVKHFNFQIPSCTPAGDYNFTYHELDRINSKTFYSIYSTKLHITNTKGTASKTCKNATPPQTGLIDSRSPEQPFLGKGATGLEIQTKLMDQSDRKSPDVSLSSNTGSSQVDVGGGALSDIETNGTRGIEEKSSSSDGLMSVPFRQFKPESSGGIKSPGLTSKPVIESGTLKVNKSPIEAVSVPQASPVEKKEPSPKSAPETPPSVSIPIPLSQTQGKPEKTEAEAFPNLDAPSLPSPSNSKTSNSSLSNAKALPSSLSGSVRHDVPTFQNITSASNSTAQSNLDQSSSSDANTVPAGRLEKPKVADKVFGVPLVSHSKSLLRCNPFVPIWHVVVIMIFWVYVFS